MSLLKLILAIEKRPSAFLGNPSNQFSIWHLKSFIVGYQCAQNPNSQDDWILDSMSLWVCTRYKVSQGSLDWAGHLWQQSNQDDQQAFRLFFKLFEDYVKDREQFGAEGIEANYVKMLEQLGEAGAFALRIYLATKKT